MSREAVGSIPTRAARFAGELCVGDRIEKYELLRLIAHGGMGSVWAAKLHGPHGFEKIVAIKSVLPELAGDERIRAMFLDEVRLASAIHHRNVAQVVDFLEQQGALYIVLEWVDGISLMALHERLAVLGARVPIGIALRILADVCAGLHAAHELTYATGEPCGVVHRDVSPHNILVASEGSAKLIDFGVAKTRLRIAPDSTLGQLRGRVTFMAPEQAQSDALDRRADVWSVGASLFYLLTGHGPFGVCERIETLRRLLLHRHPLPPPPGTHPSVERVLSGCLARRREDRFPTAAHLGWAIEQAIEDMGVAATGKDVAELVADRVDRKDAWAVQTGRCAIPRELTRLHTESSACMVAVAERPASRPSVVGRAFGVLACVVALDLVTAGANLAIAPSAPSMPPPSAALAPSAPTVPTPSAPPAPPNDAPVTARAPTHDDADAAPVVSAADETHDTPPHDKAGRPTKRHAPHTGPKAKTGHERFSGAH